MSFQTRSTRKTRQYLAAGIAINLGLLLLLCYTRGAFVLHPNRYSDIGVDITQAPAAAAAAPLPAESGTKATIYTPPLAAKKHYSIPPKIFQILLPHAGVVDGKPLKAEKLAFASTWLALNPGYGYTLVGQREADDFIDMHFKTDAKVRETWKALQNPGVKSDLLRYLLLSVEGGVYTDIDTEALKPIEEWVPYKYLDQAKVVIGIEWDQLDGVAWIDIPHVLQFCQWTIAAAPGHPLFMRMAHHAIDVLEEMAGTHNTIINELSLSSFEVMTSSGPASWTDVVFEVLREMDPHLTELKDLSGMKPMGSRLFGDILILAIDGFGMGQQHSNSTNDGSIPDAALLKHHFGGSWRAGSQ